jgi:hypothetical protein
MATPYMELAPAAVTPDFFEPAALPPGSRPRLFVVVDTEEEFDWSAPFSRRSVGVTAIEDVGRLQAVLKPYGAVPTYVIDYPVATTPSSFERLGDLARRGDCQIGAHMHPWVNPPYTEALTRATSYACNLGHDLEHDKIAQLRAAIVEHVGVVPRVYKAGRYGFGRTTAGILESIGFDVDVSVNPHMDFRGDGGPSFEGFSAGPGFFGERRRLLELPCTMGFVGAARRLGPALHRAASTRWLEPLRAVGVLAKSGTLNKVMLSPEGNTCDEMLALTAALHRDGVRTFSLTLHSPSLKPGCTPYARSASERDALVASIDRYCDYFFSRLGGVPGTPAGLFDELAVDRPHEELQP